MSCLQYLSSLLNLCRSTRYIFVLFQMNFFLYLSLTLKLLVTGISLFGTVSLTVSDALDLFLRYVHYINSIYYYYCTYQYLVCVLYIPLNRPWLKFSGGIGIQCSSIPCLLATRPSKDSEIHSHQWPALKKLTIKPKSLLKSLNSSYLNLCYQMLCYQMLCYQGWHLPVLYWPLDSE